MGARMLKLGSHASWLEARAGAIGGSDASCIVGMNPYRSNVELWEEKIGRRQAEDIGEKPYVKYGTEAEEHLRALFALDFPQYVVEYVPHNLWLNEKYPFAHASLDGWLTDKATGRRGVLEIKTTNILQSMQREKWRDRIPSNYYCQVLWYMGVMEADFAILKAQLKTEYGDEIRLTTRHYTIEREEVEDDIQYMLKAGADFWEYVKAKKRPPLVLPTMD